MAASIASVSRGRADEFFGRRRVGFVRVTMDNSYPTNGLAVDFKSVLGWTPVTVEIIPRYSAGATGPAGRTFFYDYTNKKILVFTALSTEVVNATDLSGTVLDCICYSD